MSVLTIFKSTTGNWDLARFLTFKIVLTYSGAVVWSVFRLHQVPNWAELGGGYAALMASGAAFIGGKEIAIAKANAAANAP